MKKLFFLITLLALTANFHAAYHVLCEEENGQINIEPFHLEACHSHEHEEESSSCAGDEECTDTTPVTESTFGSRTELPALQIVAHTVPELFRISQILPTIQKQEVEWHQPHAPPSQLYSPLTVVLRC